MMGKLQSTIDTLKDAERQVLELLEHNAPGSSNFDHLHNAKISVWKAIDELREIR